MSSVSDKMHLITGCFVREQYEQQENAQEVPNDIKQMITAFSTKIFNTKILSMKQDYELLQLLSKQLMDVNQRNIKLLFRASEHDFSGKKFHEICDDHGNTLTIVESNFGNIFGGYTYHRMANSIQINKNHFYIYYMPIHHHETIQKY